MMAASEKRKAVTFCFKLSRKVFKTESSFKKAHKNNAMEYKLLCTRWFPCFKNNKMTVDVVLNVL